MLDFVLEVAVGAVGGWMAGLLGIGGGIVLVPAMVLLLDRPQQEAQGVSLAVIIMTAVAATSVHRSHGLIDGRAVLRVTPFAMLFGAIGGALANQLPADTLQRIFAVVPMLLSLRMIYGAWSSWGSPADRVP